jgi:hypothetical protein
VAGTPALEAVMAATERITMTMRELDRFKVIQDVADGRLKPWRAAERLRLTTRQIRRLVARLREQGPAGLVSRRRSMPSNNRLDSAKADQALSVIRDRYADFGPTLACEKLRECHGISLSVETVRYRSRMPRFGKVPRSAFNAHRPPRTVETDYGSSEADQAHIACANGAPHAAAILRLTSDQ